MAQNSVINQENIIKNGVENHCEDTVSFDQREKINQRRQARKRKILDNAKIRLEKLGGNYANYAQGNDAFFEYPDPEVQPNAIPFYFCNKPSNSIVEDSTIKSTNFDPFADEVPPKEHLAFQYRLHVLITVALTYILVLMDLIQNSSYFSVFIPTGVSVVLELVLKPPRQVNPLAALAVTLCGMQPRYANVLWRLVSTVYDLVIDFGLSIFSIVSLTLVYNYMSGKQLAILY